MKFAAVMTALGVTVGASAALGQGTDLSFGTADHDASQPVEVTSDQLNIDQSEGTAVFTGNVVVIQGELTMTATRVIVEYTDTEPREIDRILAFEDVVLVNGAETAEGDEAVYTMQDRFVVMTGDVVVTQPDTAISGDLLTVNLDSGTGVMEGRVRTVLRTGGN